MRLLFISLISLVLLGAQEPNAQADMSKAFEQMAQAFQKASKEMKKSGNTKMMDEDAMQNAMLNALGQVPAFQQEFQKAKKDLPKTIALSKEYRACLARASTKSSAKTCAKKMSKKAKKLGLDNGKGFHDENMDDFGEWTPKQKKEYLKELDESIAQMEKALPCLQKAKTLADMAKCQKPKK